MQERAVTVFEALQSEGHIYVARFLQSCSSHSQCLDREGLAASISYCRTSQEALSSALQHLSKPISSAGRVCVLQRVQTDVQELLQDETQLGAEFPVELMANQPPGDAGRVTSCSGHHLLRHQLFAGVLLTSSGPHPVMKQEFFPEHLNHPCQRLCTPFQRECLRISLGISSHQQIWGWG